MGLGAFQMAHARGATAQTFSQLRLREIQIPAPRRHAVAVQIGQVISDVASDVAAIGLRLQNCGRCERG